MTTPTGPACEQCGNRTFKAGACAVCGTYPTLGFAVCDWIEANCVIPDGEKQGEPYLLTEEMMKFLIRFYRINPDAKRDRQTGLWRSAFHYLRGAQLIRPQKWGKGPFSASWILVETAPDGPVLFDGWDADGKPVGRPWSTPWVQVTAVSEDQTDNVWRSLVPMIELGDLKADIPDTGITRINLADGGIIEPVTASARSRLGQRITGAVQDETHSWLERNSGHMLAYNQRRNLAGMGGRFLATTNAWNPAEDSSAQRLAEGDTTGVLLDDIEPPKNLSIRNKAERKKALKIVYGDSYWVDPLRIDAEIVSLLDEGEGAQAERFFFNRKEAGESAAFDIVKWESLAEPKHEVKPGALVTVGVDGARFRDAIAVVGCEVETGFQWPILILERPQEADDLYEHDVSQLDGAIADTFETYEVWRVYVDDQHIREWVSHWQGEYGDKRVVQWHTNRPRQIAWAVRNYTTAINTGDLSHDGNDDFTRHVRNARRMPLTVKDDKGRVMHSIRKDRRDSPHSMDAAMGGVLAWEARQDAIAAGAEARLEPLVRIGQ